MKMKHIYKISALFVASLLLFSCTKFEEFESEDLGTPPTASLQLVSASDSIITVSITSSANGYVAAVIIPGSDNEVPENPEVLALNNIASNQYFYSEATASAAVTAVFTEGLEQNSVYEVMAVVADENGVLSGVEVLQVQTSDMYPPALVATYPDATYDPVLLVGDVIYLEFDEEVTAGSGSFTFETVFEGGTYPVPAENIAFSGVYVEIQLPFDAINGDYVLLSCSEGAVKDMAGNDMTAINSAVVGSSLTGIFWRTVLAERDYASIAPDQAAAQAPGFNIELTYAEALDYAYVYNEDSQQWEEAIEDGSIVLTYYNNDNILMSIDVPVADVSISGNVITIAQTNAQNWTGTVSLEIPAGLFEVGYGNPMVPVSLSWETTAIP